MGVPVTIDLGLPEAWLEPSGLRASPSPEGIDLVTGGALAKGVSRLVLDNH